jgi:homoserine dehydrogenase
VSEPIVVLKFGSSVLRSVEDLPDAVHEIYRHLREGKRIVAVVSALGATTDELLARARAAAPEPDPDRLAALLATGERAAVEFLALALGRAGLPAHALSPEEAGVRASGSRLDADPVAIDGEALRRKLDERPILVLPGFVGIGDDGRIALLGRGGSDLSALFVAEALGAERCLLLKNVDGLYERDPASPGPRARRFSTSTYERALALDGRILQAKAVSFAAAWTRTFEVGAIHGVRPTRVGARGDSFGEEAEIPRLRVVLAGLGSVGLGVARELARQRDRFDLVAVASRRRPAELEDVPWVRDPGQLLRFGADAFIELTGAAEAGGWIRAALDSGIDVVTADKDLLARKRAALEARAAASGARLLFSAAVGGALPAIESVRRAASKGRLRSVEGVLNATTNFVLTQAETGASFAAAVEAAHRAGLAERDLGRDLDGSDAACKLSLLAHEAFGTALDPDEIPRDVLDESLFERARDACLRIVARATRDGKAEVRVVELSEDHPLAARGIENRLVLTFADGTTEAWCAAGAGRDPTTIAVLADLLDLARSRAGALVPQASRA